MGELVVHLGLLWLKQGWQLGLQAGRLLAGSSDRGSLIHQGPVPIEVYQKDGSLELGHWEAGQGRAVLGSKEVVVWRKASWARKGRLVWIGISGRVKGTEQGAEMRPQTHSLGLWGLAAQIRITSSGEQESFPVGSDQRLRNWFWAKFKQQMWGNRIQKSLVWNQTSDLTAVPAEVICRTLVLAFMC